MVLRRSGKPMLVVPDAPVATGASAVIAFDGSSAARRALDAFAQSGLAAGRELHVVAVDDDGAVAWDTATRGAELLRAHNLAATVHNVVSLRSVAEAILEQTGKLEAGLLVLGAYVPSRLTRWLWGSVTHELLEKTTIPLFLHY
jgi:nucleotide-binding universal stress UspA family protein